MGLQRSSERCRSWTSLRISLFKIPSNWDWEANSSLQPTRRSRLQVSRRPKMLESITQTSNAIHNLKSGICSVSLRPLGEIVRAPYYVPHNSLGCGTWRKAMNQTRGTKSHHVRARICLPDDEPKNTPCTTSRAPPGPDRAKRAEQAHRLASKRCAHADGRRREGRDETSTRRSTIVKQDQNQSRCQRAKPNTETSSPKTSELVLPGKCERRSISPSLALSLSLSFYTERVCVCVWATAQENKAKLMCSHLQAPGDLASMTARKRHQAGKPSPRGRCMRLAFRRQRQAQARGEQGEHWRPHALAAKRLGGSPARPEDGDADHPARSGVFHETPERRQSGTAQPRAAPERCVGGRMAPAALTRASQASPHRRASGA